MSYQKYKSKQTIVDGIKFQSKLEAERYQQLKFLLRADEIADLKLQPEFQIFEGYIDPLTGEKHKSRYYIGDFQYVDVRNHQTIVEDTKGIETDVFKLKWELVQEKYPEFVFRKMTRKDV